MLSERSFRGAALRDLSPQTANRTLCREKILRTTVFCLALIITVGVLWFGQGARAQLPDAGAARAAPQAPSPAQDAPSQGTFLEILQAGGPVGVLIMLLSVAAVALVIEHLMTIRPSVLMPPGFSEEVRHLLASGNLSAAQERCRQTPSFLGFVLGSGLAEADVGRMLFYAGIGGRVKAEEDDSRIGVRVPLGLDYVFAGPPLDVFFEVAPVLDVAPGTDFRVNGGIGIRYYF